MTNNNPKEDQIRKYNELFPDEKTKAKAFDAIAEEYYYGNFGSTSKVDLDTLLFSLYFDQLLKKYPYNYDAFSDYTMSKLLGITQTIIRSLKERKELRYPNNQLDWKNAFAKLAENFVYEDEKIKLMIPDKNLFLEIKNAIESKGGFIEIQLSSNLLQVRPPFFLDLLMAIEGEHDQTDITKEIQNKIRMKYPEISIIEKQSFGMALLHEAPSVILELIGECIPVFGKPVQIIGKALLRAAHSRME